MSLREEALELHAENKGKIEVISKVKVENSRDLSLAYTPGVAEPCKEIHKDPELVYKYTNKGNMVAVVTDGSAVLGLGNIGARAGMPVMEGKAVLFKSFANVDAFPICIESQDVDTIVETVKQISPSFGGVNLEDISAPRCFEVEARLKEELDIPVFHDDQHGTAIVVLAAVTNALKIVKKDIAEVKIVINGAGSAGTAIANLLMDGGAKNIIACDMDGALYNGAEGITDAQKLLAQKTNPRMEKGSLKVIMAGADVFIGVSAADVLNAEMVESMNSDSIVIAMANPVPEIMPDLAKEAGARVVGTGRSDFPNQINNVLAFPGVFRGALDVRASEINEEMKLAAAYAIAELVADDELNEEYIIPAAFDKRVATAVAEAVSQAAIETGVNRV